MLVARSPAVWGHPRLALPYTTKSMVKTKSMVFRPLIYLDRPPKN